MGGGPRRRGFPGAGILTRPGPLPKPYFLNTVGQLHEIFDHLKAELRRAQEKYAEGADARRLPAPRHQIGDQVWLDTRNITTRQPSRKLDHRRLGPFEVVDKISPYTYRL